MLTHYGLIGMPLGHSASATLFNEWFAREGIPARYDKYELASVDLLPDLIDRVKPRGLNVTSPYKQQVLRYVDTLTPAARAIGAVNCLRIDAHGITGHNTDADGFIQLLDSLHLAPGRALLFGTGGAAQAVLYALQQQGWQVTLVSRTKTPDRIAYADVTPDILATHSLLIQATPLGMPPHADECIGIPYHALGDAHTCIDLIYNPAETLFMRRCAESGARVRNGLSMLHGQAAAAWRFWNDK